MQDEQVGHSLARWAAALGVAVLLHLALLMVGSPIGEPKPERCTPSPLQVRRIVLTREVERPPVSEPVAEQTRTVPEQTRTVPEQTRTVPEQTRTVPDKLPPVAKVIEPQVATAPAAVSKPKEEANLDPGPRRLDLYPRSIINRVAVPHTEEMLEGDELAAQRLKAWAHAFKRANQPALDVAPGVKELGRRFEQWFVPEDSVWHSAGVSKRPLHEFFLPSVVTELPKSLARHAEDGKLLEALDGSSSPYWDSPARRSMERLEELSGTTIARGGCAGACGKGNAQAHLVALIEIDHDVAGLPAQWRIAQSSGVTSFDEAALHAVEETAQWVNGSEYERPAVWSQWSFSAIAYQWSRGGRILDPQFVPPGKPLDSKSSFAADATVVRTVRLVAVRYRERPE